LTADAPPESRERFLATVDEVLRTFEEAIEPREPPRLRAVK
jgi:hypothetical protein